MSRAVLILGGLAVGGLAVYLASRPDVAEEVATAAADTGASLAETVNSGIDFVYEGFGLMRVSNMRKVSPDILGNANVQAMLRVIRNGEGTADAGGYSRLFGGGQFSGFADHPRITVRRSGYSSTAAGAYQMLSSTWDETAAMMNLPDFSPRSQDLAAVGRIAARNALPDVLAGRFAQAIAKINREWASLPGSPYGQPTVSMNQALNIFLAYGGQDTGEAIA